MIASRPTPWALDGAGNPLVPPSVLAELREIDPRLGLQYHAMRRFFAVTLQWPENDPRYQMIRDGALPEDTDFEILCPVPADIPLDEMRGWLAVQLRRVGSSRSDVKQMVEAEEARIQKANDDMLAAKAAAAIEECMTPTKNISIGTRRTKHTVAR